MGMVTAIAFFWSNKPNPAIDRYSILKIPIPGTTAKTRYKKRVP